MTRVSEDYITPVIDEVEALDQMVEALVATFGEGLELGAEALGAVMGDLAAGGAVEMDEVAATE